MKPVRFFSLAVMIAILLTSMGFAEEVGEMDLYAPEIYVGECAEEAPAMEMSDTEIADAEPDSEPAAEARTVALTGRKAAAQMNVGETLRIAVNEGEAGIFTSKSAKLATVDASGLVTALAKGKVKIEFKPEGGRKRTLSVSIADPWEPTGVSLGQGKAITLNVGEELQLSAALVPDTARAALTWKSSRTKVATVDADGRVTAIANGKAKITVTTDNGLSDAVELQVTDIGDIRRSPAMNTATYNGVEFKIVNTAVDPIAYAALVRDNVCTHPMGTDKYGGYCLRFSNYYVSCMVDNVTDADVTVAKKKSRTSKNLQYSTEKYSDPAAMMARLYDLLGEGLPQILMVEAITHPGSRHFVAVVGYRSGVTRREDLRTEDLLIIDSFDGKLESMDPAIEPVDTRVLFRQRGKYRIEAVRFKS